MDCHLVQFIRIAFGSDKAPKPHDPSNQRLDRTHCNKTPHLRSSNRECFRRRGTRSTQIVYSSLRIGGGIVLVCFLSGEKCLLTVALGLEYLQSVTLSPCEEA